MIDTVIFDMDGTILNTIDDLADSLNYVLAENGFPTRTLTEVLSFVGNGIAKLVELGLPKGHSQDDFERVFARFRQYYKEHMNDKTRPYKGIVELMERLKNNGYKLAIVSNKFQAGVTELQNRYYSCVDVALGEQEGLRKKPAPDLVNLALEKLGSTPETAVYIGDSEVDLQTAQNASLPCISVLWGFRSKEELLRHGAVRFASTPEEIEELLKKL